MMVFYQMHTGTILYTACDNGIPFIFIETADGTIYHLYFAEGIEFRFFEGQVVDFDYIPAAFDSPCSIADRAVIVTCIQEANKETKRDDAIFNTYPWLLDLVNPATCSNETITVYKYQGYTYLYIETATGGVVYNDNGQLYCTSSAGLNCLEFYQMEEILSSWTCNDLAIDEVETV